MNQLFLCSRNQWRSPTAERLFRRRAGLEVRSAGTGRQARRLVREDDLRWADLVLAMEDGHRRRVLERFPDAARGKVQVLGIPDDFRADDPDLVALLEDRVIPLLRGARWQG